jgi:hypothetical protein
MAGEKGVQGILLPAEHCHNCSQYMLYNQPRINTILAVRAALEPGGTDRRPKTINGSTTLKRGSTAETATRGHAFLNAIYIHQVHFVEMLARRAESWTVSRAVHQLRWTPRWEGYLLRRSEEVCLQHLTDPRFVLRPLRSKLRWRVPMLAVSSSDLCRVDSRPVPSHKNVYHLLCPVYGRDRLRELNESRVVATRTQNVLARTVAQTCKRGGNSKHFHVFSPGAIDRASASLPGHSAGNDGER